MVRLEEVCTSILSGGTPSTQIAEYWEGNIPWITSADIISLTEVKPRKFITEEAVRASATNLIPANNVIVVTRVGLGKLLVNRIDLCISQDSQGLLVNRHIVDPTYLGYILSEMVLRFKTASRGSTIQGVTKSQLIELEIPLPPLEIQRQIVAELDGYRKIIEGARQVIANYKPTIRIDPEWPWVRIGDLCSRIQYGISTPLNTNGAGYKTFRMNEIADGLLVDNGAMKCAAISAKEFSKYRLDKGDVLFNRTNSYEHVGRTGIFLLDGEYTFASYLVRLAIDCSKTSPEFLNRWMNTEQFQTSVKGLASRAIGQANINAQNLSSCEVPLPPLDVQRQIVAELEAERALVEANRKLVEIFEGKIQAKLAEIWGEEERAEV